MARRTAIYAGSTAVRCRRRDRRGHRLVTHDGSGRWSGAVRFAGEDEARLFAIDLLSGGEETIASAQIVTLGERRVLGTIWIERAGGDGRAA